MNITITKYYVRILVPYKIEGSRVSTVDILVEKDGRELEIGNEIQMRVKVGGFSQMVKVERLTMPR